MLEQQSLLLFCPSITQIKPMVLCKQKQQQKISENTSPKLCFSVQSMYFFLTLLGTASIQDYSNF